MRRRNGPRTGGRHSRSTWTAVSPTWSALSRDTTRTSAICTGSAGTAGTIDASRGMRKLTGCAYDPGATCPTWTDFLETIFDGNADMIGFVQRLAGYCLTGEVREHILPIFWGDGANGKTTLLRTLLNLMGEYGTPAPSDLLVVRKHKDHPTELMVLMG